MTLRDWLARAPFGLAMSSGFFGFFAHAGFLAALEEERLVPAWLSGSSAGALAGGLFAAGLDAAAIRTAFVDLRRADFWDPAPGLGLLRGAAFRRLLMDQLPAAEFAGCRAPLAVSVFDLRTRTTRVLRHGDLASAIHASCALPVMFHPVLRDGRWLSDGGIADRPGILGLASCERVLYHHIVSRSPWRRRSSSALRVPERAGLVALSIPGLMRPSPWRLARGALAADAAYRATRRALAQPVAASMVEPAS